MTSTSTRQIIGFLLPVIFCGYQLYLGGPGRFLPTMKKLPKKKPPRTSLQTNQTLQARQAEEKPYVPEKVTYNDGERVVVKIDAEGNVIPGSGEVESEGDRCFN